VTSRQWSVALHSLACLMAATPQTTPCPPSRRPQAMLPTVPRVALRRRRPRRQTTSQEVVSRTLARDETQPQGATATACRQVVYQDGQLVREQTREVC
jgi:hypothetical protein